MTSTFPDFNPVVLAVGFGRYCQDFSTSLSTIGIFELYFQIKLHLENKVLHEIVDVMWCMVSFKYNLLPWEKIFKEWFSLESGTTYGFSLMQHPAHRPRPAYLPCYFGL